MIGEITKVVFSPIKGEKDYRKVVVEATMLVKPTLSKSEKCFNFLAASTTVADKGMQNAKGQAGVIQLGGRVENPNRPKSTD